MSSRNAILAKLRAAGAPAAALPEMPAAICYADPEAQFAASLASVGGRFLRAASLAEGEAELRQVEAVAQSRSVVSLVPGLGAATLDPASLADPHQLEGIDLAILPGELAVAENAAVWVPGAALGPHRAIFVIAQHLVLVVPASGIVDNMQQAYERIRLERSGFGVFISGPSKTADIEQSLVIGAHGARSCTVLVVG